MEMKKRMCVLCLLAIMAAGCSAVSGCGGQGSGSGSETNLNSMINGMTGQVSAADQTALRSNAFTIDTACKNYYAAVVTGMVNSSSPGNVTADVLPDIAAPSSEKNRIAQNCTVYGALQYERKEYLADQLSEFCVVEPYTVEFREAATGTIKIQSIDKNTKLGTFGYQ